MLTYELDRSKPDPIYIQIYQHIRADIELGNLTAGEKLPSKRELASNLGVSIITVENAYAQLVAEGYIRSVLKTGYFVEKIEVSVRMAPSCDEVVLTPREQIETENRSLFPFSVWAKLMREELAWNQSRLLTRPPSEGVYELREAIAAHLKAFRNMDVSPEQIIIGAGTEYLYILLHMLLGEQSFIGVEEPGYAKIAAIYASLGLRCAWIPMEQDGISLDALQKSGADAVHISPSHHFPTGAITSIGKRYALLGWAAEGRYIIEDDYDSEFRLAGKPIPSMFSIDVTDRVIYMNTFSKSLTPTIRISYMILPFPLLERYRTSLGCYSCAVSTFEQYTLASFIKKGYFEKHIHRMRKHCRDSRDAFFKAVQDSPLFQDAVITGTSGGLHCLVTFDTDLPDTYLLEEAQKMDLHASLLSSYFHVPPTESLHQLVIEY